jgi:transposase
MPAPLVQDHRGAGGGQSTVHPRPEQDPRPRPGRPPPHPDAVAGDKAYSSRANRAHLRKRGIKAVIPEKKDQAAHRKNRGSRGGRPVTWDKQLYKLRNSVERTINKIKDWRGLAVRYDKKPESYHAGLE